VYDPPSISGRIVIKAGNHVGGSLPVAAAHRDAEAVPQHHAEKEHEVEEETEMTPVAMVKDERISSWLRDNESRDSAYYE
jgi:hypothetical protein